MSATKTKSTAVTKPDTHFWSRTRSAGASAMVSVEVASRTFAKGAYLLEGMADKLILEQQAEHCEELGITPAQLQQAKDDINARLFR